MTTESTAVDRCRNGDCQLVRLLFVTQSGVVRTHAVDASKVESAIEDGVTLSELVHTYNALGIRDKNGRFDAAGEVRLCPDPETFRELPYAERTAAMLCDIETVDGEPWAVDPRSSLRAFVRKMDREGLSPEVAFESEFHLFETDDEGTVHRVDERGAYATESTRETHGMILSMIDSLKSQDIPVEKYYPEYAAGKHEIVTGRAAGVRSADEHVLLRETVNAVARDHGYGSTFLPKPFEHSTNGCHIHLSLWDDANRFYAAESDGLSPTARHFIGGVLTHAHALTALTAPTANSYARLRPQLGATGFVCWGHGNREALVRVPAVGGSDPATATRIEFRAADCTANSYLALLGILAAGYDGIDREIAPPDPVAVDPATLSDGELEDRAVKRLPRSLGAALEELESDRVLREALGDELFETYLQVKRSHWDQFTDSAGAWERNRLRSVY